MGAGITRPQVIADTGPDGRSQVMLAVESPLTVLDRGTATALLLDLLAALDDGQNSTASGFVMTVAPRPSEGTAGRAGAGGVDCPGSASHVEDTTLWA